MHQKERVIAPLLERELGIKVVVPPNFDVVVFREHLADYSTTAQLNNLTATSA
jgi:hypothetical protein